VPTSETEPPDRRALFAGHLRHHRGRLFGYIHALVRNLADADDVFQQTALALWRRFDAYDPARGFLPWALGVARLEAASWLRARARDRLRFSDDLTAALLDAFAALPDDETSARRDALPGCVDKLPDADRALLTECYQPGAEVAAVAARLGRSAPSVHNSLARIRRALHECVERTVARGARGSA
jgi:RNA polymerase sigma-70 factor (ECF subfamily)